ncbi:MAG: hypothetical protein DRP85_08230 [Candidatus Makaraimicrobium thalassicum]|nr:MAG: hypothetical protein DRP85_08230 [Candidatus Omnitrophota bacterium]
MSGIKTKSVRNIEQKMENVDADTLRYQALQGAKGFKTSWIDLGRILHLVWKDRMYKDWGYASFSAYAAKEIGVREQTALKLLKSYAFLKKEEPRYLGKHYNEEAGAATVPTYESVDVLRRAEGKKELDREDYVSIKKCVLEKGKDAREAAKDLAVLIKRREELQPEDVWQSKRRVLLKRLVSLLKAAAKEIKISKMLSIQVIRETDKLIDMLEAEITHRTEQEGRTDG